MKMPSFIQSLLVRLAGKFNAAVHAALEAVRNLTISDAVQEAAHDAVLAAEQNGGTGAEKFNAAVALVRARFTELASGAIQTAVQNAWGAMLGK